MKITRRSRDRRVEPDRSEPPIERRGIVKELDDPKLPSVVQLAGHDSSVSTGRRMIARAGRWIVRGVDDVGVAAGLERFSHHRPERVEAGQRNVREPEAHENQIVTIARFPVEKVGENVRDVVAIDACAIAGNDLGRGIDRRHMRYTRREVAREQSCPACQLENAPRLRGAEKRQQRLLDDCDVVEPRGVEIGTSVEAPLAKPPLVVFAGARTVIRDLIGEERGVARWVFVRHVLGHAAMIAPRRRMTPR
jgi:hypothetical protein